MLTVHDLTKRYTRRHAFAIRGISFDVPAGTFFTLLGPSGCGKTTTLRCIAGLEEPEDGIIRIGDREVFSPSRNVPPESRPIGMVFQSYAIWPHMTVYENAAFPLRFGRKRLASADVRKRTESMLERVGLAEFSGRWATQLSGGQQQRLALARALLCEPQLLLLDEPLSNLDAKLRTAMRSELKQFQRAFGVTTIYVTHDQGEALALSDSIAVLNHGTIQQIGPPKTMYERPENAFVASFIGDSTLVPGKVRVESGEWWVDCELGSFRCLPAPQLSTSEVWLCLRPEVVQVQPHPFPSDTTNTALAQIQSSEFLGDRLEMDLTVGQTHLKVRVAGTWMPRIGDMVHIHLPKEQLHLVPLESEASAASESDPTVENPTMATHIV